MTETGALISRIYSSFRGVDFRGEEINLVRSPDSLNVWKDYKYTESIRTRPGMKLLEPFDAPIYGIFFYLGSMLVHSGNKLYKITNGVREQIYTGLAERESDSFIYEEIWYFKDGKNYLAYDGEKIGDVVGFVPTTSISRIPAGGGKIHQEVNFLSPYRINTFLADGESTDYYLDTTNIDADYVPEVRYDGHITAYEYTVDYKEGIIKFAIAPAAPNTDGQDNISIKFKKAVSGYADNIHKCTMLQVFDNRVFFSGNPEKPNVLFHCELNDPTYCGDLNYYIEGVDMTPIKGLVAGNDALWVFREPSQANTTVFYHQPTNDAEYGKIYPSRHSSVTTGCVGKAINFNDDIVLFSERGMEGISGDVTTEQVVAHRSSLVDRKMISETNYKNMILAEWEGYLIVFIGNKAYLADSRTAFTYEDHIEYEWFYWEMEKPITFARVDNGVLYLGTDYGVYAISAEMGEDGAYKQQTDDGILFESYWVTPKDKFKAPQKLKTTNKRGCVVEAGGDIDLYAKVEDTDFELIGSYTDIKDYFVSRIKRKKFKDIQLKFYSQTRFSLETATLECFIGGYIKR